MSAHGAVGGRVTGDGNTSTDQQAERPDLGDPAADPIGTWRIAPFDEGGPQDFRREYDPLWLRAVRVALDDVVPWALVDLDGRGPDLLCLPDEYVRTWPVTPATVVAVAMARAMPERPAEPAEPARVLAPVEGEDVAYPFRDPKGK
jgi:hypothetical protein